MDVEFGPEITDFRLEVRGWIGSHAPEGLKEVTNWGGQPVAGGLRRCPKPWLGPSPPPPVCSLAGCWPLSTRPRRLEVTQRSLPSLAPLELSVTVLLAADQPPTPDARTANSTEPNR